MGRRRYGVREERSDDDGAGEAHRSFPRGDDEGAEQCSQDSVNLISETVEGVRLAGYRRAAPSCLNPTGVPGETKTQRAQRRELLLKN